MPIADDIESALKMIQQSGRGPTVIYYGREWAVAMRDGGHDPEGKFLAAEAQQICGVDCKLQAFR